MWRAAAAAVHQANAPWWGSAVRGLLRRRWLALRAVVVRARFFFEYRIRRCILGTAPMNIRATVRAGFGSHNSSVCRWLTLKFQVHFSAVVMMLATQL